MDELSEWEQELEKVVDRIKQEKSTLLCIGILKNLIAAEIEFLIKQYNKGNLK